MRKIMTALRSLAVLAVALALAPSDVKAQGVLLPDGSTVIGHMNIAGSPPVGTGCTIASGSTDTFGRCLTTAAAGSIAFARAYVTAPACIVQDSTGTPLNVYTTTTTQITLTTVTAAHVLYWICFGFLGG